MRVFVDAASALLSDVGEPVCSSCNESADVDALERASAATEGYPFMIQLVGYHSYRQRPERMAIDATDVDRGVLDPATRVLTI